ncbi:MAG: EAL domain-containing protein [Proteobacteria bacterium]|nr:EAL domain-containing protein [Pseudomonadota bacterium]
MRGSPLALQRALPRRLAPLAYALAAVVGMLVALTWLALSAQVSAAGILNGESVWSKAQKQVIIDLDAYAENGDAERYAHFEREWSLLQSDRWFRDAMLQPVYDEQKAMEAYARGDMMPTARVGIFFAIRHLAWAPHIKQALADWRASDAPLDELEKVADRLHAAYATGAPSAAEITHLRNRIQAINATIAPLSTSFSLEIAHGAEWLASVLFMTVLGAASVACLLWLWMARRVLAGIRGSEERYRLLFDSAADAIVMVDEESGRILDANRTTAAWTGKDPQALLGKRYAGLFENRVLREGLPSHGDLRGADGKTRPVEMQSSTAVWGEQIVRQAIIRDISERVESESARRIAAEALASIAEGVIIADPERRMVSVNAAVPQITGFSLDSLADMRLDDSRRMLDGGPIPQAVWDEIAATHQWSGEVLSHRPDGSKYIEKLSISTIRDAGNRVQHYVAVFSDISVAKADRGRLEHLATHDALTGLVNRAEFQRQCEVAIANAAHSRTGVVVMFIDLDAFKFVNDSYSHAVGDSLLMQVADRIRQQLGERDVIGRIGGDEFTVLLTGQMLREDAAAPASRLLAALSEPFQVEGYEVALSASIGIAGYPLDGDDAQALMANADAAMYAAKSEERNAWRFYVPMMQADTRLRMQLATELRQALANDEFHLVYQPSVELRTGRIVAVEALLRWQHPERGVVMPGDFIPIAESIGMIHRIDEWVMRAVCRQIRAWDADALPAIRVALNVSARWLGHPGFVEGIRRELHANGIEPSRIALEITEGAILRLGDDTDRTMRALHALGIGVAIDDFGTGYASMAYLKLPAVAYLKIDRSFITGLPNDANDAAITNAMLAMAASLGLSTIAEGLENEAQHEFLLRAGCTEGQGYLYSYPLPPAALERMLKPKQTGGARLKLVPRHRG